MSEPTYKIVTEHDLTEAEFSRWSASVVRISDEKIVDREWAASEGRVIDKAREWIKVASGTPEPGRTLYATEDGTITEQVPA